MTMTRTTLILAVSLAIVGTAGTAAAHRRRDRWRHRYQHHHHRIEKVETKQQASPAPNPPPAPPTAGTAPAAKGTSTAVPVSAAATPASPALASRAVARATSTDATSPTARPGAAGQPETTFAPSSAARPPATQEIDAAGVDAGNAPAGAAEAASVPHGSAAAHRALFPLTVGVEFGATFSQVLSSLGTSFTPNVEVGYLLPALQQKIEVFASAAYLQPLRINSQQDPRLVSTGAYRYTITEQELLTSLGGLYRLFPPGTQLNFYGQLGVQVHWQRSNVMGNADGVRFGKNQETKAAVGVTAAVGSEFQLGPGALAGELDFDWSPLRHRITGKANAGGLFLQLGYHFLF